MGLLKLIKIYINHNTTDKYNAFDGTRFIKGVFM